MEICQLAVAMIFLPPLICNDLGIHSIAPVFTHKKILFIRSKSVASVAARYLYLISPVDIIIFK